MMKPQTGLAHFKPTPDAPCQVCIVCGVNEDGSVNLLAFDHECDVTPHKGAVVVQRTDDEEAHYAPACCASDDRPPLPPVPPPPPPDVIPEPPDDLKGKP